MKCKVPARLLTSVLLFSAFLLSGFSSLAQVTNCTTWPTLIAGTAPSLVMPGTPFNYSFRLSCRPGARFVLEGLNGSFVFKDFLIEAKPGYTTYPLPSGETLYQILFFAPKEQPAGFYALQACLRINDVESGWGICLPVPPRRLEVVKTN